MLIVSCKDVYAPRGPIWGAFQLHFVVDRTSGCHTATPSQCPPPKPPFLLCMPNERAYPTRTKGEANLSDVNFVFLREDIAASGFPYPVSTGRRMPQSALICPEGVQHTILEADFLQNGQVQVTKPLDSTDLDTTLPTVQRFWRQRSPPIEDSNQR